MLWLNRSVLSFLFPIVPKGTSDGSMGCLTTAIRPSVASPANHPSYAVTGGLFTHSCRGIVATRRANASSASTCSTTMATQNLLHASRGPVVQATAYWTAVSAVTPHSDVPLMSFACLQGPWDPAAREVSQSCPSTAGRIDECIGGIGWPCPVRGRERPWGSRLLSALRSATMPVRAWPGGGGARPTCDLLVFARSAIASCQQAPLIV